MGVNVARSLIRTPNFSTQGLYIIIIFTAKYLVSDWILRMHKQVIECILGYREQYESRSGKSTNFF